MDTKDDWLLPVLSVLSLFLLVDFTASKYVRFELHFPDLFWTGPEAVCTPAPLVAVMSVCQKEEEEPANDAETISIGSGFAVVKLLSAVQ